MKICIPTRGRVNSQPAWDRFPREFQRWGDICLVCPPDEVSIHQAKGRRAIPRPVNGIANVRQWICQNQSLGDKVIMVDDDLTFFVRSHPTSWKLRPANPQDVMNLFERLWEELDQSAMVGISPRQMNNVHFPEVMVYNTKINAVQGVRTDVLKREGIRYDQVDIMEDYHVCLSLLERGYGNSLIVDGAWDQVGVSGAAGGCSLYRTAELQKTGALNLHQLHPDFVTVVEKTPKGGWDGMKTRTDVRVGWVKAYKSGIRAHGARRP